MIHLALLIVSVVIIAVAAMVLIPIVFALFELLVAVLGAVVWGICMGVCTAVGFAGLVLMSPWTVAVLVARKWRGRRRGAGRV